MSTDSKKLAVALTRETLDYLELLYKHGAFEQDKSGRVQLNPKVKEVIGALHATLAGGNVVIDASNVDQTRVTEMGLALDKAVASVQSSTDDQNVLLAPP